MNEVKQMTPCRCKIVPRLVSTVEATNSPDPTKRGKERGGGNVLRVIRTTFQ